MTQPIELPLIIDRFFDALNSGDEDRTMALLSDDVFVNDAQREFWGKANVAGMLHSELFAVAVSATPIRSRGHHDVVAVDATVDGTFEKQGLPDPLVLTFYFTVREGHIARLFIMRNRMTTETTVRPATRRPQSVAPEIGAA